MTRPPRHSPDATPGIAALLGAMLCALLTALLGRVRLRPRDIAFPGVMAVVLRAEQDVESFGETEPYEEWIAVPAPWRAGQGVGRDCARRRRGKPCPGARTPARERGPPWPHRTLADLITGMA